MRLQQGQQRMHGWAGRPRGQQLNFPRPPFLTQFTCTMSDWMSTPPLPSMLPPRDFAGKLEAARWAVSQTRGGFRAPSGPGYKPMASALPKDQAWHAPGYNRTDPRKASKKPPGVVTLSPLKQLLSDHIPPNELPSFMCTITDLQEPTAGETG